MENTNINITFKGSEYIIQETDNQNYQNATKLERTKFRERKLRGESTGVKSLGDSFLEEFLDFWNEGERGRRIFTESVVHTLRENCPNTEFFLVRKVKVV